MAVRFRGVYCSKNCKPQEIGGGGGGEQSLRWNRRTNLASQYLRTVLRSMSNICAELLDEMSEKYLKQL